jgi:hypothetical protein
MPAKNHKPLVFDAATSVVARGKITLLKSKARYPLDWALDKTAARRRTQPRRCTVLCCLRNVQGKRHLHDDRHFVQRAVRGLSNPDMPNSITIWGTSRTSAISSSSWTYQSSRLRRLYNPRGYFLDRVKANKLQPALTRYSAGEIEYTTRILPRKGNAAGRRTRDLKPSATASVSRLTRPERQSKDKQRSAADTATAVG